MDKVIVSGFVPLTRVVLKEGNYLGQQLVEINVEGVVSLNNRASIRVGLEDLKKGLRKLGKKN